MHLILDGCCEPVMSAEELETALADTVQFLNVNSVLPVVTYVDVDGITLVQIIAESHICIHTVGNVIHIDIFSCKDFAADKTVDYLRNRFSILSTIRAEVHRRDFGVG